MMDILVLTDRRYVGDGRNSGMPREYVNNVLHEDRLVLEALQRIGLRADRVAWCDASVAWDSCQSALFRTTWDYFDRWPEFSRWLDTTSAQTSLLNAPEILRWNLDKHYLRDLERVGVAIVPTVFVAKDSEGSLVELLGDRPWDEVVVKPAIAGAALDTYRLQVSQPASPPSPEPPPGMSQESLWQHLVAKHDMLVQPFLHDVVTSGEISLIWMDGEVTHAVLKQAKAGDFRVQDDHGGTARRVDFSPEQAKLAIDIMRRCQGLGAQRGWAPPLYARVDLMQGNQGQWLLSELEMVEPELWLRHCPEAADVLARAVKRRLEGMG